MRDKAAARAVYICSKAKAERGWRGSGGSGLVGTRLVMARQVIRGGGAGNLELGLYEYEETRVH